MSETNLGNSHTGSVQIATPENIKALFRAQPLPSFLQRVLPPKDALVEGLLYKRDIVAMLARRRHGKTTFASQMALALACGEPHFLGYKIPRKRNVVFYYLEDDPTEVQLKLARQLNGGVPPQGFHLYTRRDLMMLSVHVDASDPTFKMHVELACWDAEADLLVLDNLGHLIGADYNNAAKVHELVQLIFVLQERLNLAVVISAHPRKVNGRQIVPVSLLYSSEQFFEECMGSSHFINSTGSLWGLQRDSSDKTYFLGGAQRFTASQSATELEKDEHDCFCVVSGAEKKLQAALNTEARQKAWALIPVGRELTFTEIREAVNPVMRAKSSVWSWVEDSLVRLGLLEKLESGNYRKTEEAAKAVFSVVDLENPVSVPPADPAADAPGTPPNAEP